MAAQLTMTNYLRRNQIKNVTKRYLFPFLESLANRTWLFGPRGLSTKNKWPVLFRAQKGVEDDSLPHCFFLLCDPLLGTAQSREGIDRQRE